ncbi:hypothetical protein VNO78_20366 [Psophocarpus tetragonolobus]|uniref:Uncharacterized protein n=1 Tax=Psophocarpus tetragonolobus TaxID=3891 RepID=A0AAN9XGN3_PSOTE
MLRLVVSYLIEEYSSGRTSNPNHYANVIDSCDDRMDEPSFLELSLDMVKDQTYFLSHLSQSQLKRLLAPLGCIPKEEVYRLARKFDLPNKDRKNSQGICFLGKGNRAIVVDEPEKVAYNMAIEYIHPKFCSNPYFSPLVGYPTKADMQASGLVISASPGGPAFRTSVSSRDVILAIDDTSTENMGLYDAAKTTGPRRKLYSFDHS